MIIEAILKINPNAKVVVIGDDINTCEIEWRNGTTPISKADIEAKIVELQADYDAKGIINELHRKTTSNRKLRQARCY